MMRVPVLIVGGGMAGLTLALLLRQAGQPAVRLVEAAAFAEHGDLDTPSFDARSTALSEGTLRVFERLGLRQALLEQAEPIHAVDVSRRQRLGQVRMRADEEGLDMLGAVIENRWLGRVLLDASRRDPAIQVSAPATVRTLQRTAEGWQVTLEDGETLLADLVVAADGARSRVRDRFGITARHQDTGHDALITNIGLSAPHHGVAWERFLTEGPLALLPLTGARMAVIWTGPRAVTAERRSWSDRQFLQQLHQAIGPDRMPPFTQVGTRHGHPLVLTQASAQVVPHGVVVGNAAHTLHPVAGQGFNLSLRDLAALARRLGDSATPGALGPLQDYAEERQADQALIVQASRWVPELFRATWSPFAHGRQLGLVALDLSATLRSRFAARAMGL